MRCNEFSVFITFTKDARKLPLSACTRLVIDLVTLSLSFLVFLEFVGNLAPFYFVVFQHFQSMLRVQ